jgi:hypothetical protein
LRKRIGLAAIGAVLAVVAVLFVFGGVKLNEFTTQLAVGLTLLIPITGAFMIKPQIESWINSGQRHNTTNNMKLPMKQRRAIFTHASQTPDVKTHDTTKPDKKSVCNMVCEHPTLQQNIESCSAANAGVENGCCIAGAFAA